MATGYTSTINKDTTFKDFALTCARAFGACIEQRDSPMDEPPRKVKVRNYHLENIKRLKVKLARLKKMSVKAAEKQIKKEAADSLKYHQKCLAESIQKIEMYNQMLEKVKNYNPPTPEHKGLKDFMIEQLESSIKFDDTRAYHHGLIAKSKSINAKAWLKEQKAEVIDNIKYNEEQHQKEVEKANRQNKWIDELYKSL